MKFTKYQQQIINDESMRIIILKARQIGATTAMAYKCVRDCIFKGRNQIIVSQTQKQSNIISNMIEKYLPKIIDYTNSKGLNITVKYYNKGEIVLSNGNYIVFLPCNPNSVRGYAGDVWIDEFAFHQDDEAMFEALSPITTRGYKMIITSTPLGMNNMFYKLYSDEEKYPDYKRYKINIYDAKENGLEVDIDYIIRINTVDTFNQEYMCEWIDESTAYFTRDLILKRCVKDYDINKISGDYIIGLDIGRVNDPTAIITLCKMEDKYYIKEINTLNNKSFDEQFNFITNTIIKYNPIKIYGDKTGVGMQLIEDLEKADTRVEGIMFSNTLKNDLYTNMKKNMEQGKLIIPNDENLIRQLHAVRLKVTQYNNTKFETKRDKSGHGDIVTALGLALLSAKENEIPSIYIL